MGVLANIQYCHVVFENIFNIFRSSCCSFFPSLLLKLDVLFQYYLPLSIEIADCWNMFKCNFSHSHHLYLGKLLTLQVHRDYLVFSETECHEYHPATLCSICADTDHSTEPVSLIGS
jgi:hypothetical protein